MNDAQPGRYTYPQMSLIAYPAGGWKHQILFGLQVWLSLCVIAAFGTFLFHGGRHLLLSIAGIGVLAIPIIFGIPALIQYRKMGRHPERPTSVELEDGRLRLYHGSKLYAEVSTDEVVEIAEHTPGGIGSLLHPVGGARTVVHLRWNIQPGINYFYIYPELLGYSQLMRRLISQSGVKPEESSGVWTLSRSGRAFFGIQTLALVLGLIVLVRSVLTVLGISSEASSANLSVPSKVLELLLGLAAFLVVFVEIRSTATRISFRGDAVDVTRAGLWQRRIPASEIISMKYVHPAGRGFQEGWVIRFPRGHIVIRANQYEHYLELVERFRALMPKSEE